jgi:hypothetical protein
MVLSCQPFNLKMDRHFLRPFFDLDNLAKCVRTYLKISSSSWKTKEISSKGALKLEVPKMPKMS